MPILVHISTCLAMAGLFLLLKWLKKLARFIRIKMLIFQIQRINLMGVPSLEHLSMFWNMLVYVLSSISGKSDDLVANKSISWVGSLSSRNLKIAYKGDKTSTILCPIYKRPIYEIKTRWLGLAELHDKKQGSVLSQLVEGGDDNVLFCGPSHPTISTSLILRGI
jgi:hypothetical protein